MFSIQNAQKTQTNARLIISKIHPFLEDKQSQNHFAELTPAICAISFPWHWDKIILLPMAMASKLTIKKAIHTYIYLDIKTPNRYLHLNITLQQFGSHLNLTKCFNLRNAQQRRMLSKWRRKQVVDSWISCLLHFKIHS